MVSNQLESLQTDGVDVKAEARGNEYQYCDQRRIARDTPQVNRGVTNALSDMLNYLICSKVVDIISQDELKANFFIVFNQLRALSIQSASARDNLEHKERPDV
jgi:hypothetical protein